MTKPFVLNKEDDDSYSISYKGKKLFIEQVVSFLNQYEILVDYCKEKGIDVYQILNERWDDF